MANECTQDAVLRFLTERGGRVKNVDLIEYFRSAIPTEHGKKAAAKEALKRYVDSVAVVKVDNGEKYVCLKKKFRRRDEEGGRGVSATGTRRVTGAEPSEKRESEDAKQETAPGAVCGFAAPGPGVSGTGECEGDKATINGSDVRKLEDIPENEVSPLHLTGGLSQGSCDGTVPDGLESLSDGTDGVGGRSLKPGLVGLKGTSDQTVRLEATSDQTVRLEATSDQTVRLEATSDQTVRLEATSDQTVRLEATSDRTGQTGIEGTSNQTGSQEPDRESDHKVSQWLQRKPSGGSQRDEQSADEGNINTPKGSRKSFIEHMMSSSPQVRRSVALRNSVYLSTRSKDSSSRNDADDASLHSSSGTTDDENAPVALEPLEHEWMMCASDGKWESLEQLLAAEPGLVCKKDFVTGFTCLHWAAKLGKVELLALLVSFATQHGVLVDVNTRSSAGYTPLHLAAMHNHMEVVKLLVGAYDADVEARDYSGKRASQYLRSSVAHDVLDIIGAGTDVDAQGTRSGETSGWRFSKVLQANLRPLKLLSQSTSEDNVSTAGEGAGLTREKVLHRKSSLRSLRPRLSKIRARTQIVHSTSLSGHFEREAGETAASVRSRPKSNLFG